jgi:hypothetical protein
LTSDLDITQKVAVYAEVFGFAPQKSAANQSMDGGFMFLVKPNIQLDVEGGFGLTDNAPDYFVGCGLSLRVPD